MLSYIAGPSDGISTDNAMVRWDGVTGRLAQNSPNGPFALDTGLLGIATPAPTHSLTLASTATGVALYNTADQTTNYERALLSWVGNVATLSAEKGGSGTLRGLNITNGAQLELLSTQTFKLTGVASTDTLPLVDVVNASSWSSTTAVQAGISLTGTVNQTSGTGGFSALLINPTLTAVGSAGANLIRCQVGGAERFRVDSSGVVLARTADATPAGGALAFRMGSAAVGISWGSGAPTLTAPKGSLYLRTDGSGTGDRAYLNTDGGTTWTALVTVA